MNWCGFKKSDIANGEGVRATIFVSGCTNRCKNCFQPETWDFSYGEHFGMPEWEMVFSALENPSVRGLTVLGGEPMEPQNQTALLPFLKECKRRFPTKTIWLYTGNLYEELIGALGEHPKHLPITAELLSLVDILVDGRYEEEQKSLGLRFRGSANQRIIDLNKTRQNGTLTIWEGTKLDRVYSAK